VTQSQYYNRDNGASDVSQKDGDINYSLIYNISGWN
jgi:hypothetical protein